MRKRRTLFARSPKKILKQTIKSQEDSIRGIIGIGTGDGSPAAREHDKFLYAKRKKK